jgi:proteasome accessory factor B
MSREKTERLLNLTMALLGTRTFLTKSQILSTVAGYEGNPESLDRMFERDKDDLRELGIPIEVQATDPLFDDEPGYRIERRSYQLPALQFTAREMGWLSVAAQAWQRAALSGPATEGLRKLIATGAEPEEEHEPLLQLSTPEPAFPVLYDAVRDRRVVRFSYRRAGSESSQERTADPWGLLSNGGRWYLVGRDHDRDQVRVFRLSRIEGDVLAHGPSASFTVADDIDLWSHLALLDAPAAHRYQARLHLRSQRGLMLRRQATHVEALDKDWDVVTLPVRDTELSAREIAAVGDVARVVEPAELRDAVINLLKNVQVRHG